MGISKLIDFMCLITNVPFINEKCLFILFILVLSGKENALMLEFFF